MTVSVIGYFFPSFINNFNVIIHITLIIHLKVLIGTYII